MKKPKEGQRREHNAGITLIALIITIIILLILAIITIRILMNQGIIRHANNATSQYKIAEEKEKIALGYQNYKMDKIANPNAALTVDTATVEGSEAEGGWTITFTETGNVYELDTEGNITKTEDPTQDEIAKIRAGYNKYVSDKATINSQIEQAEAEALNNANQTDLDLLRQYCIGNNDKDLLNDILNLETNPWTFKDNEPIPNASTELAYKGIDEAEVNGNYEIYIYFTYNETGYKLTSWVEYTDGSESYPTKKVEPIFDTTELQEQLSSLTLTVDGATVQGNENEGWTITYTDTGNKYTLNPDGTVEAVKELSLDKNSVSLGLDTVNNVVETKSIKAITKGGLKGVTWTIADNSIATLDKVSGTSVKVTAVKEGTTTVTATGEGLSATCTIVVDKAFKYGDILLRIGDYIAYDATKDTRGNAVVTTSYTSYALANADSSKNSGRTNGYTSDYTFNVNNYTSGWRVLGVENGKLQLISASSVGNLYLYGKEGYRDSEEELNAICGIYGQGKGAVAGSARSINVDDVNAITGYNPAETGNGNSYRKGEIDEYGNNITYYWQGSNYPYYSCTNELTGNLTTSHNNGGFNWWDDTGLHNSPKSTTAKTSARERITTLKNTYYEYFAYSLTTDSSTNGEQKGIAASSNEYSVLFGQTYWLASRSIRVQKWRCYFRREICAFGQRVAAMICSVHMVTHTELIMEFAL